MNGRIYGTVARVINFILFTPTVGIVQRSKNMSWYDSVLISRLRIGYCHLTNILSGTDPPTCQSCRVPLTVNHILVECAHLWDIGAKYLVVSSICELCESVDDRMVIDFIKETHFYSARNCIASAVLATAIPSVCPSVCLSVCLSVRLSHAGIVSKRRHVARCSLHRWIAKCV